jgi:bifunctional enzyme CysN/CysC
MTLRPIIAAAAMLAAHAVAAQEHRFETDPVVSVRENFVACDVLSRLQRVMEDPRFLLGGECVPLRAGDRFRVYAKPFRMPVQWVNRLRADFRGYCGTIVAGRMRQGDRLALLPAGRTVEVARIVTASGDLAEAAAGMAVTLTLTEEVDVSRGDVFAAADAPPAVAEQFCAHVLWMSEQPMLPGRSYLLQIGTARAPAQITELKHKVNVNTFEHVAAKHLELNEIAVCNLALDRPVAFDPYAENRDLGAFILIDRLSNATRHDRI